MIDAMKSDGGGTNEGGLSARLFDIHRATQVPDNIL